MRLWHWIKHLWHLWHNLHLVLVTLQIFGIWGSLVVFILSVASVVWAWARGLSAPEIALAGIVVFTLTGLGAWAWESWRAARKTGAVSGDSTKPSQATPPPNSLEDVWGSDFPSCMKTSSYAELSGSATQVQWQICEDFQAATKFVSFYLPPMADCRGALAALVEFVPRLLRDEAKGVTVSFRHPGDSSHTETSELQFSGRVYVYTTDMLSPLDLSAITELFKRAGMSLIVRGGDYLILKQLSSPAS